MCGSEWSRSHLLLIIILILLPLLRHTSFFFFPTSLSLSLSPSLDDLLLLPRKEQSEAGIEKKTGRREIFISTLSLIRNEKERKKKKFDVRQRETDCRRSSFRLYKYVYGIVSVILLHTKRPFSLNIHPEIIWGQKKVRSRFFSFFIHYYSALVV